MEPFYFFWATLIHMKVHAPCLGLSGLIAALSPINRQRLLLALVPRLHLLQVGKGGLLDVDIALGLENLREILQYT